MKKWFVLFVAMSLVSIIFWSCSDDEKTTEPKNTAPVAQFTVNQTNGSISTTFEFDASSSYDEQDKTEDLMASWNFGESSIYTEWSTEKMENHKYSTVGVKTVKLIVKDSKGLCDTTQVQLNIDNQPPVADFKISPTIGTVETVFEFDATSSNDLEDGSNIQVKWDFEGDGVYDTSLSSVKIITHKYNSKVDKNPTLYVVDTRGASNTKTIKLTLTNLAPVADFTATPSLGTIDTNFSYDASASYDIEGSSLTYRWDFEGDGTFDTQWNTTKIVNHKFTAVGTYNTILEVKDSGELTGSTTKPVKVATKPVASFSINPSSGDISTNFAFDASGSTDNEDNVSILQVRWDFEGDGIWDTNFSTNKTASHVYTSVGSKNPILEVKDSDSFTSTDTKSVVINNTVPVASFTFTPTTGYMDTNFSFDASSSSDLEDTDSQMTYRWDWENDGVWDTSYSNVIISTHKFTSIGSKTIKLEVKDSGGLLATTSKQIVIENKPPVANFSISPTYGYLDQTFSFDGSSCSDLEDNVTLLQVRWDWNNDSVWDTGFSMTKTATKIFSAIGVQTVAMEVKDTGGLATVITKTVEVRNRNPVAAFTVSPSSGTAGTTFSFNASGSSDAETSAANLQVRWDWNNDGSWDTSYSTTKTASRSFSSIGTNYIKLEVKDEHGGLDTETHSISILGPTQSLAYDDGSFESGIYTTTSGQYLATRFTLPSGWSSANIEQVQIYCRQYPTSLNLYKWNSYYDSGDQVYKPNSRYSIGTLSLSTGWSTYTTSSSVPSTEFFVGLLFNSASIGVDTTSPHSLRTYGCGTDGIWFGLNDADWGIRIVVRQTGKDGEPFGEQVLLEPKSIENACTHPGIPFGLNYDEIKQNTIDSSSFKGIIIE